MKFSGHAIEVRLCAEDAGNAFMPQSGTMLRWAMPERLRVEHAMAPGAEISPFYDSMIAKVIAHGPTREAARRGLVHGLQEAVALGVTTNQHFLARCLAHSVFAQGGATTAFIAQHQQVLLARDEETDARACAMAALALLATSPGTRSNGESPAMGNSLPLHLRFTLDGTARAVTLTRQGQRRYEAAIAGRGFALELVAMDADHIRAACEGVVESVVIAREGARLLLRYRGQPFELLDQTHAASARPDTAAKDGKLRAMMNGRVVAVLAAVGDRVQAGQAIVTLEAMKIQHMHAAPLSGVIRALNVSPGDQVSAASVLAEIEGDGPADQGGAIPVPPDTGA